ncbi:MAG TPA: integrin alpha [Solirubrobacteraceae bacterium]
MGGRRWWGTVGAAFALAAPATASAGIVDASDSLVSAGPFARPPFGTTIAGLGDVNGDGLGDVAMLQEVANADGRPGPSVTVVFGSRERAAIDAAAPGGGGFVVDHATDQFPDSDVGGLRLAQGVGMSVAAAGDVNADGLADLVVGAASLGNSFRRRSGSAFVVFGKRNGEPVHLDALGDGGFRVDGPRGGSGLGYLVAGLGDVNGDGRSDVALSAAKAAYVVFGKPDGGLVDLRNPGESAYAISGPPGEPDDENVHRVYAAGDANGDGRGDVAVITDEYAGRDPGVWVVFGKPGGAPVDLRALGAGGYEIPAGEGGNEPNLADGVGDVNGDRRDDLLLTGGTQVVYGRTEPGRVDLGDATRVLTITRTGPLRGTDFAGGVGDVTGDGLADLAFGNSGASGSCRTGAGAITFVPGRAGGGTTDAAGGFTLVGDETGAALGQEVEGAGDVNGDGRADVVVAIGGRERREVRAITAVDTGRPAPDRGQCVTIRSLTRSLRQARAEGRWRVSIAVKEPRTVQLRGSWRCLRRCPFDNGPDFGGYRDIAFEAAGARTISVPLGRLTLRRLRRGTVVGLLLCADALDCVSLRRGR